MILPLLAVIIASEVAMFGSKVAMFGSEVATFGFEVATFGFEAATFGSEVATMLLSWRKVLFLFRMMEGSNIYQAGLNLLDICMIIPIILSFC